MRNLKLLVFLFLLLIISSCTAAGGNDEKVYYAIEINGVVCGYSEVTEANIQKEGKEYIRQNINMYIMLSLFGSEFNNETKIISLKDPVTKKCYQL